MTTGVCSKTVARGHKIRANPPHSTPRVCPLSIPFACGWNESKWRHRTLTTLTHFPLRSAPLRSAPLCAGALVAESHDSQRCTRIRDVQSGRVFARKRHFYDGLSSSLYLDLRKNGFKHFFYFISRRSYFPFQAQRIRCKLWYQARNTVRKSFYYLCSCFLIHQLCTIAI